MRLSSVVLLFSTIAFSTAKDKLKIGIVGGGIGGTGAAYYISKKLGSNADITIFEANSIGGRLRSIKVGGRQYEAGGAIAISRNRYIVDLLDELHLKKRCAGPSTYAGLYDGKEVVFAENSWMISNIARLFWRYGTALHSLNNQIGRFMNLFDNIYKLQEENAAYDNVASLIEAMDPILKNAMTVTTEDAFKEAGFSSLVIKELVAATIHVNYGQTTAIHSLVGSVSVAGAGGGLWAVDGGNQQVPERLADKSGATVVTRPVTSVTRLPSGRMAITVKSRSDIPPDEPEYAFDVVIIATPQTVDMPHKIDFIGFTNSITFSGHYHRTVCTMLIGKLNGDAFPGAYYYTDEILTTADNLFFNSMGRIYPVDTEPTFNGSHVYKVFSQLPLKEEELQKLFTEYRDVTVTDWLAYPRYSAEPRSDNFILAPGLYHVNAIEWAASAMEMSLVGAHNVANLVRNKYCLDHECPPVNQKGDRRVEDEL